jgi:hypothetical protein
VNREELKIFSQALIREGADAAAFAEDSATPEDGMLVSNGPHLAHSPIRVFIFNARADQTYRSQLVRVYLQPLIGEKLIAVWHPGMVVPGEEEAKVIAQQFEQSELVLLLVSADFLASRSCQIVTRIALSRQKSDGLRVVPIILRPCDYKHMRLGSLQVLPKNAKPLTKWANSDSAWLEVVKGLRTVVGDFFAADSAGSEVVVPAREPTGWPPKHPSTDPHPVSAVTLELAVVCYAPDGLANSRVLADGDVLAQGDHVCCFLRSERDLYVELTLSMEPAPGHNALDLDPSGEEKTVECTRLRAGDLFRLPEDIQKCWEVPAACQALHFMVAAASDRRALGDRPLAGQGFAKESVVDKGGPLAASVLAAFRLAVAQSQMVRVHAMGTLSFRMRLGVDPPRRVERLR